MRCYSQILAVCVSSIVSLSSVKVLGDESTVDDSSMAHAQSASILFERGEIDGFRTEMRAAIQSNPGDIGQEFTIATSSELSSKDLEHGEEQVSRMLRDRPAMAALAKPKDELWTWAVRRFAGEGTGVLLDWDDRDPSPFEAYVVPGASHGRILVRQIPASAQVDAVDRMWSLLVYELHNALNMSVQIHNEERITKESLTREEYILACFAAKDKTAQRTRAFYVNVYLPFAQEKEINTSPSNWHCYYFFANEAGRESYLRTLPHWRAFSTTFDLIRTADDLKRGDLASAAKRLNVIQSHKVALSREHLVQMHYQMGQLLFQRRDLQGAIREFSAAKTIDPLSREASYARAYALGYAGESKEAMAELSMLIETHAEWPLAYHLRAHAYSKIRDWRKAVADYDKAIQLSPDDARLYLERGRAHAYDQKFDLAWKDFSHYIKKHPDRSEGYAHRAGLSMTWKEVPEHPTAVEDATKSCELTDWKSTDEMSRLVNALRLIGNDEEANRIEEKIEKLRDRE